MVQYDLILIKLLYAALFQQKPDIADWNNINWEDVFQDAVAHQVHTIIYPVITQIALQDKPEEKLRKRWQKEVFYSVDRQLQHIGQMITVFQLLHNAEIPIIVLKGLAIRYFYPFPELRTMGDADLMIPISHLEKTGRLLLTLGYQEGAKTKKHISYHHRKFPDIEVHWTITDEKPDPDGIQFTDNIWEQAQAFDFCGIPVLTLSDEDQLLHLLIHASEHMKKNGFGLRQLCDLALFTKAKYETMEWEKIYLLTKKHRIYIFAAALYRLCNQLFGIGVPKVFDPAEIISKYHMDQLLGDIYDAGVYGTKTSARETACKFSMYMNYDDTSKRFIKLKYILNILFPSLDKLHSKYGYAHAHPYLLPVAWLHRAINNLSKSNHILKIRNKDISCQSEERSKLLHWLELR